MARVADPHYQRDVRVMAPLHGVYREMDTVDGLVRFIPQIGEHRPEPGGGRARCRGTVSLGPLTCRLTGEIRVQRVDPPHAIHVLLESSELAIELDGTFELIESAEDETTLRYAASIRSEHPLVRRMRSSMTGLLEEHVDSTTDLVAVRVRQYTSAARRFADIADHADHADIADIADIDTDGDGHW